jgi:hypothetical protein
MRNKLRRMSAIVYCLQQRPYTIARLHTRINHILSDNYSQSSIEKDIFMLREEFDCPIEKSPVGLVILEDYDFIAKVTEWVQLYE